ncbi:MAG: Gfo/Idh/MocA family oxidoreductase [Verrucomicrobiales bacterium]|jgi:myo-inositol 2-dehydrogenase/D-chiro-inositol 1-dehydrogenase|nr:Gfo/Idh/MocA family oxidoreductase [Verrucomicrobiales bacterium]|tara:strand:- start:534 stop:1775 length:1242 start_codon:yes stop_codon:yes gene_type:complete
MKSNRRKFLKTSVASAASFQIVPRHVIGGQGHTPPSETYGAALIGCGGRGPGTYEGMVRDLPSKLVAACDVQKARVDGYIKRKNPEAKAYNDFRKLLENPDVDLVAIATPPHWHALISIAAAEAGKDVLCEKPMTRFIAEGRAVVEAFERYKRVFQIGTFGRFGASRSSTSRTIHKIMRSGLLDPNPGVHIKAGGLKLHNWSGKPGLKPQIPSADLDWDLYCGPSPFKPYVPPRVGGTHRNYWDYEGGGMCDMGQHHFDPQQWIYGKDDTSPVTIEAFAPPSHPDVTGMWAWVELTYADGFTFVMDSKEWGPGYKRKASKQVSLSQLSENDQKKIKAMPDPKPLLTFGEAVKQRKQAGGHPEAAHRAACILHLANLAIRLGRKLQYDPEKEQFVGDEEANRFVNVPMRSPWHL